MFKSITPALALAVGALAMVSETVARDAPAVGRKGGGPFRSECGTGAVLVGFKIRAGKALDNILPVCTFLDATKRGWGGKVFDQRNGPRGGGGGKAQTLMCANGQAVKSLQIVYDRHLLVQRFDMRCGNIGSGQVVATHRSRTDGQRFGDAPSACSGNHEWATGIHGRHGALVDQLGLICNVPWASAHCDGYATGAVQQANEARKLKCANLSTTSVRWSTNKARHVEGCTNLRGNTAWLTAETATRKKFLDACRKTAGGGGGGNGGDVPPPPRTVTVVRDTNLFDGMEGNATGRILREGTRGVTLVEPCIRNWCHVRWPAGQGWVYSGGDHVSLKF